MAAQPRASSACANAIVCSMSQPPSTQSVPDTRIVTARSGREGRAHRIEDFERKAHAVLEAAAILVIAPVGERRQKLVQQIAMRAVELDRVDPEPRRALRRRRERLAHPGRGPARSSATGGFSSPS